MNIEQAIDRVKVLGMKVANTNTAIAASESKAYGRPARVSVDVYVEGAGNTTVLIDRQDALALLHSTKAQHEAEIAKLAPVIEMANTLLKGMQS